ncbi:MAG TPA: STAS domain-containing protein [Planctomycetota bacterium]|nr:STAS domain-containing protein [Planctomycetota bacterium]
MAGPEVVEVRVHGEVGMASVPALNALVSQLFNEGHTKIVFNLSDSNYLASSAIGTFLGAAETARGKGGDVVLAGIRDKVRHVLDLMGVPRIVRIAADTKEAVGILGGRA